MTNDKQPKRISPGELMPLEIRERLRGIKTILIDLDGSLYPGPSQLEETLALLPSCVQLIPITARSFGELQNQEDFPGKKTLVQSPFGIFESGFVIKRGEEVRPF